MAFIVGLGMVGKAANSLKHVDLALELFRSVPDDGWRMVGTATDKDWWLRLEGLEGRCLQRG